VDVLSFGEADARTGVVDMPLDRRVAWRPRVGHAQFVAGNHLQFHDSEKLNESVLAKGKTATGRCWVYVRDDRVASNFRSMSFVRAFSCSAFTKSASSRLEIATQHEHSDNRQNQHRPRKRTAWADASTDCRSRSADPLAARIQLCCGTDTDGSVD
jgi:hypothetical protein